MSQQNVERFVQGIDAFNRRDLATALSLMDPEIVWEHRLAELEGKFAGFEGVTTWFTDLWDHFESMEIDCRDVRDLGDRVLALGTVRALGKGSGVETNLVFATVATFKNGRLKHFIDYGDRAEALESAGLAG